MDIIRSEAEEAENAVANQHDQRVLTLVLPSGAFAVLGVYKHRGNTEAAIVIDEATVRPLALSDIDAIVAKACEGSGV